MFCVVQSLALTNINLAQAKTITDLASNTATVSASCSTPTTATLSFGTYSPLANTTVDGTTTISVKCTNTTPISSVALSKGYGAINARTMQLSTDPTKTLSYGLYLDSNRSTLWGDGTFSTSMKTGLTGAGLATDVSMTVYGRIFSGQQTAKPGSYSDTITVTVTY